MILWQMLTAYNKMWCDANFKQMFVIINT